MCLPPPLQNGAILDLGSAKSSDKSARFPSLAKHLRHVLLRPGSLKVEPFFFASLSDADARGKVPANGNEESQLGALQNDAMAMAELSSADFEQFCKEHIVETLARQDAVKVSLDELRDCGLSEAADFLRNHKYRLKAQRKTLEPFAIVFDFHGREVDLHDFPCDVCAELSRKTFAELATRLLDIVSLQKTGFCSADARDPRFIYNRLAPLSPDIRPANDLLNPEATPRLRLIRVEASSRSYTAFQHAGTRIDMTRMLHRTVNRLTGGSIFLRYIAPYEPSYNSRSRDLKFDVALEERLFTGIKEGVFVPSTTDGETCVVPASNAAFVVLLSNQGPASEVLDAAQDIVCRCLSGPLAEDVGPKQKPYDVPLESQDELPAAIASLACQQDFNADVVCFCAYGKPQKKWSRPFYDLPTSITFVNVRELRLCKEALRWFLDQPVALVAARARLDVIGELIHDDIAPESLARLAWLLPPKQRRRHMWLKPLQAAFEEGK